MHYSQELTPTQVAANGEMAQRIMNSRQVKAMDLTKYQVKTMADALKEATLEQLVAELQVIHFFFRGIHAHPLSEARQIFFYCGRWHPRSCNARRSQL